MSKTIAALSALGIGTLMTLAAPAYADSCKPAVPDSELVKPGTLVMSTNPTLPPLQFVDSSGELKGMRITLGTEIAKRLCLTPDYVRIEFSAMVPGLQAGRWDMINTGIFWSAERAKIMQMIPYESQAISISVAKGNPLGVTKPEDLAGHEVSVELGGFEEAKLRELDKSLTAKGLKPIGIHTFDTFAAAYQALRAGQVEATVSIDPTAAEYAKRGDFDRPLHGLFPTPVAFAMKSKVLTEAVLKVLNDMQQDGSYGKLMDQYGLLANTTPFVVKGPTP
ncbi:MAG: ABC transporter substrate-binding protein [Azospirillaceae bacterium]|nr:ABC transporter substrate-binding protein [Azospirillaceae bacterium]